ncbi:GNAT family N-acetyltransferase [Candidatus Roizmanbacteria bacterium]|nr:GNAT family N-acetyltransferase [Candidatus Roizmanbacteria bacterium]
MCKEKITFLKLPKLPESSEFKPCIEITDFCAFDNATNYSWALHISEWTKQAKTMLPQEIDTILEWFQKGRSVILLHPETGTLVGHAAATFFYPDNSAEIGALYIVEKMRREGYAKQAVSALINHLKKSALQVTTFFALANSNSGKVFDNMNAEIMPWDQLHPSVYEGCNTCPNKPTVGCCDTPYNLTTII